MHCIVSDKRINLELTVEFKSLVFSIFRHFLFTGNEHSYEVDLLYLFTTLNIPVNIVFTHAYHTFPWICKGTPETNDKMSMYLVFTITEYERTNLIKIFKFIHTCTNTQMNVSR